VNRFETDLLLIPGPTPIPPPIARVLAEPMISHRGSDFAKTVTSCAEKLKPVFATTGDVLILTASGTGGMEAALGNALSPGDRLLTVEIGVFGRRWAEIARGFGLDATSISVPWGQAADPAAVEEAITGASSPFAAIAFTHNETSTGVTNRTREILEVARRHGLLTIVDCISGLLATEFAMDDWGADIVVGGSQKAFAIPPGLAFVAVSPRGWDAIARSTSSRYYFDLEAARTSGEKGQTPYTPAVGLFRALDVALDLILADGVAAEVKRHAMLADAVRAAIVALDLPLFADPAYASNAVTAITPPEGVEADAIRSDIAKRFSITFSGGQKHLRGRIFRISHMGAVEPYQLLGAIAALEIVLPKNGWDGFGPGAGCAAAEQVFARCL
jgi:aspartate aminotransferase-like enzyme